MTRDEALKLALEALEMAHELEEGYGVDFKKYGLEFDKDIRAKYATAITAIKQARSAPVQEPVAWMDVDEKGAISGLRYWSEPDNRHEIALYTTPPAAQPEERNFCSRCGKRTRDLTTIHTCTPPQEQP
jgi:hypothetical protein